MYTMTIDGRPLYDPTITGCALEMPSDTFEANKIGTMIFTIYPGHPEYYNIMLRLSIIRVYRDGIIYSVFRPVRAMRAFQGGIEYTCEELTALLNDFMHRPAAFPVNPDANTARDLMQLCLTDYNARSAGTKVVPPREYVESLYPFTHIGNRNVSAGHYIGTPYGGLEEIEIMNGPPYDALSREIANVLAVLGYYGNIYIPPTYDWSETSKAVKKFAVSHNLRYGQSNGYQYDADYGMRIHWEWPYEYDYGWDGESRCMDFDGIVAALNVDYQDYLNNLPDENDPDESVNDQQPFTFSVGDTPAAYESEPDPETGDQISIPLTMEKGGYSGFWDYMQEAIIDQLGGYIIPEWGENSCTLHYKRDEHLTICDQAIEFGENMVDLVIDTDSEKVYSIVIPIGKDGLTINTDTTPPEPTIDDTQPDYIADVDAVDLYGKREMTKDWPDIDDPQQLKYTATQWLMENAIRLKDEFEVNALDLRYAGVNVGHLEFMQRVRVVMAKYGIDQYCTMTGAEIALDSPAGDVYHFNGERDSLVDKIKK